MKIVVFDTESDGLYHDATKFWVFGWTDNGKNYYSSTESQVFHDILSSYDMAICHNAFLHDFPLLKKFGVIDYKGIKVDSLYLSWYLFPERSEHGLGPWGEDLGVSKVHVDPDDWQNLDIELAHERVKEDVKINWKLWVKQEKMLKELYK